MRVRVTTFRMRDGQDIDSKVIDRTKHADERWLHKHMVWCFNNAHGVQIHEASLEPPEIEVQRAMTHTRDWLLDRAMAADHDAVLADLDGSYHFAQTRRADAETLRSMAR